MLSFASSPTPSSPEQFWAACAKCRRGLSLAAQNGSVEEGEGPLAKPSTVTPSSYSTVAL